jgi:hypothetical protein
MMIPFVNRFTCLPQQLPRFINKLKSSNYRPILDYANENKNDFQRNFIEIDRLISNHENTTIALKLSSLNVENDYEYALQCASILIDKAIKQKTKILIDAEDYIIQDKISDISNIMLSRYNKSDINVYKTYQMYRKDALAELKDDMQKQTYLLGCKLVRGAYYNQDYKYDILYDTIDETHRSYNDGIRHFIDNCKTHDKLLCATHNEESIYLSDSLDKNGNVEYAQLMGMSDKLSKKLSEENKVVYKYLPYGHLNETLPYLVRRLYENYPMVLNIFK